MKQLQNLTVYECLEKKIDDFLRSELNIATFWICMNAMFFGMSRFYNFLLIDATDWSKISSNHHRIFFDVSLYPLLFFANTLFKKLLQSENLYA